MPVKKQFQQTRQLLDSMRQLAIRAGKSGVVKQLALAPKGVGRKLLTSFAAGSGEHLAELGNRGGVGAGRPLV